LYIDGDSQVKSNVLPNQAEPQIPLRLVRGRQDVDPSLVVAQPTLLGAIKLCISLAGFDADKQVYGELGIDAGHWTRIIHSEAHFPVDKLSALMDLCGNEAPLLWLANARGYDPRSLRKLETETERALRIANESLEAERVKVRVLTDALRGITP
jgi:hypothetical protein